MNHAFADYLQEQHGLNRTYAHIIELVCAGMTNDQIANRMRMNPFTIKDYLLKIYRKEKVNSRVQIIIKFLPILRDLNNGKS